MTLVNFEDLSSHQHDVIDGEITKSHSGKKLKLLLTTLVITYLHHRIFLKPHSQLWQYSPTKQ